jgi:hypothetical protein
MDMFIDHLNAKFHIPSSNGSLIIAIKPKTEQSFRKTALSTLQEKKTSTKVEYFTQDPYIISGS